jgi:hypothetical protein
VGDDIDVHWYRERGHVSLTCGSEAFARIVQRITDEVALPDEISIAHIQSIEASNATWDGATQKGWRDRAALLDCALVAFLLFSIFAAGIVQIVTWFLA